VLGRVAVAEEIRGKRGVHGPRLHHQLVRAFGREVDAGLLDREEAGRVDGEARDGTAQVFADPLWQVDAPHCVSLQVRVEYPLGLLYDFLEWSVLGFAKTLHVVPELGT
jgi:hypothetical protein